MRFRCALIAICGVGAVAEGAWADDPPAASAGDPPAARADDAPAARTEDPRAVFGLPPASTRAAPSATRAGDLRDVFGLPRAQAAASCDDPESATGGEAGGSARGIDCAIATDPLAPATPYALSTWLPRDYLRRLPVADATQDQVASYALGAFRDEAGVVIGGATGLENRWTIDGAPADNLRTGAADTLVPIQFLDGLFVSAGGFSARDRASTGGVIDARLRRGTEHHEVEVDAWTGLSRAPSALPSASGSFTVRKQTAEPGPFVTGSAVATGPIAPLSSWVGGTAWYAAGIAPKLATRDLAWRANHVVDADGDGVPDGLPGEVVVAPIERTEAREWDYFVPVMARVGADVGVHHFALSLVGDVARDSRFLGNSTLQAAGVDRRTVVGDAIATWEGAWSDVHARVQLTWHRSSRTDLTRDDTAARLPQLLSAYVPAELAEDSALATACADTPGDPVPTVPSCPVPFGFFASGGAGPLVEQVGDRPTATADVAYRIGDHVLRAGVTGEDSRLVTTTRYTGGELDLSLFPGELTRRRFYDPDPHKPCTDEPSGPCTYTGSSQLNYRTVYAAAYAEDTFTPLEGLSIDAGLRWELMWVGPRLHFSHELAPRLGVVWDPLGGGRSRVWASYGRTFAMLPAGLGATVIQRDPTVDDSRLGEMALPRTPDAGATFRIAPGTDPIEQDEVALGAEVALAGALRATVWGQGRYLRHGLETTPDGFTNPGAGGAPSATRETELVAFQLELRKAETTAIRAGVMWGRTVGTWTGPFDPRLGANQLDGPDWDRDASNLYGPLPTSAGARMFVEAERRFTLGDVACAVATRLTAGSGRPRNVLASGVDGIVELLPRGSAGTGPMVSQANLRLAARWAGFDVTLDVINLFDRRDPINLDEVYTSDPVRPVVGGSASDLVSLKTVDGAPARRLTSFQLPTATQPPLSAVLGVHKAF